MSLSRAALDRIRSYALVIFTVAVTCTGAAAQSINIDCGSPSSYTASDGTLWSPDQWYTGGQNTYTGDAIAGTSDTWLYRTGREGLYTDFSYNIPVANGTYVVNLGFAEWKYGGRGQRVFNVIINGTTVLPRFDILANAALRTAVNRAFTVSVTNGKIAIAIEGVVGRGSLSTIQIVPASAVPPGQQPPASGTGNTKPAPAAIAVSVTPGSISLTSGGAATFRATVTGTTNSAVTWSVSGVGTINASGVYTAPNPVSSAQTVTVIARSSADGVTTGSATVTLVPVAISISPGSATVASGGTVQFSAAVTGASNNQVTWTASAGSINSSGTFTAPKVSSATNVTVVAKSVADASKTASATVRVNAETASSDSGGVYQEVGGQVVMEAEKSTVVNRAASWVFRNNIAGYSGTGFMSSEPNIGANIDSGYVGVAPELQFQVNFSRAGTYRVWVRGYSENDDADSVHVGLDGNAVATARSIAKFPLVPQGWYWSSSRMDTNDPATLTIPSAGVHTVNVWMREDGFRIDKLMLAVDGIPAPTGLGPAESGTGSGSPVLRLSTTSLMLAATAGGAAPAAQAVNIFNGGAGVYNWTASSNQPWLTVTPTAGATPASIQVGAKTTGMAAGNYSGTITVTAPGMSGSPMSVAVSMTLSAGGTSSGPALTVSSTSAAFSATAGGSNPATSTLAISNSGSGALNWTATKSQPWITLSATSGTAPSSLAIGASISGLSAGTYSGTVTIAASSAAGSPKQIAVMLTVAAAGGAANPLPGGGAQFYVSTTGSSSGDGSISKPWNLETALAQPKAVKPGATIWVRGGTYGTGHTLYLSRLVGTASAPIIVRQYPGERATINGWLQVGCCDQSPRPELGAYVWFWGLEFASSISDRTGSPSGPPGYGSSNIWNAIDSWAPGSRYINLVIHDTRQGISWWTPAVNGEAYGNLIYNNGFNSSDRGHGHGFYVQNNTGRKEMTDNIVFNQFGWGFQLYGSGDNSYVRNMDVTGNVAFNNGIISGSMNDNFLVAGGIGSSQGMTVRDNHFYSSPSLNDGRNEFGYPWSNLNSDIIATGNHFIGGKSALDVWNWQSVTFTNNVLYSPGGYLVEMFPGGGYPSTFNWDNNQYYGSGSFLYNHSNYKWGNWQTVSKVDKNSQYKAGAPTGTEVYVRPNKYEPGRANIIIYNWDNKASVDVDISPAIAAGTPYEVRDAENFYGAPVVTGTYSGGTIRIPMTGLTVARPNGSVPRQPVHTAPQFGVFVLLPR